MVLGKESYLLTAMAVENTEKLLVLLIVEVQVSNVRVLLLNKILLESIINHEIVRLGSPWIINAEAL